MLIWKKAITPTVLTVATLFVSACGGNGNSDPVSSTDPAPSVTPMQACQSINGMTVAAGDIGLPTRGATVDSATLQSAAGTGPTATPEYCKVLAHVASVDPSASPINIQVNLPTNWNQKAVHFGGAGFDGFLVTGEAGIPGSFSQPTPLASGFVTFGSDGGHSVPTLLSVEEQVTAFLNDEVVANYAGDQLKKTRDVAMALVRARYGNLPRRTYFAGGSGGGREALLVTQRFGSDYDGSIAYYPAGGGVPMLLNFGRITRGLAAPGAYPNVAKQSLLHNAVVRACDAADGAADGLISNPSACNFDVTSLRCASGADEGDGCLSDAQISSLDTMASGLTIPYALASGETGISGYNVYSGVDLTALASGLGVAPPVAKPASLIQPAHDWLYDIFYRGIVARNVNADSLAFDPLSPGIYQARLSDLSQQLSALNSDLTTFQRKGGKLIVVQGKDDSLIPVGWATAYYQNVVSTMGAATVDSFMRYYEVPGYGHGLGAFTVDWDSLTALDNWVEKGTAVDVPTITDVSPATAGRTRPLCRFPAWPKYSGSGDVNSAASFACVAS